jgi:hypothetical protein
MTQLQFLLDTSSWLVPIVFWISITMIPAVSAIWPWWKTSWGWNIMSIPMVIAATLVSSGLHYTFGIDAQSLWFDWLVIIGLTIAGVAELHRLFLIIRGQISEHRKTGAIRISPDATPGADKETKVLDRRCSACSNPDRVRRH